MAENPEEALAIEEGPVESHQATITKPTHIRVGKDGLPIQEDEEVNAGESQFEQVHAEEEDMPDYQSTNRTGRFATVMKLLNALLGAGILSVPNSFTNAGIIPSILLLVLMGVLSHIGTVMTVKLQAETNTHAFADLAQNILGRVGSLGLSVMSLMFLVTAQLGYLILGGDIIVSWFAVAGIDLSGMWSRALVVAIYAICLPIALTLPRETTYLKYLSTTTVVAVLFFDVVLIVKGALRFSDHGMGDFEWGFIDIKLFSSLSIYGLAFALPVVVLPVIAPYNKNLRKRYIVSAASIILCFVLVLIAGLFGYLSFGQQTKPNILNNYDDDDILMIIVRGAFLLVVSFAYVAMGQSTPGFWSELIFKTTAPRDMPERWKVILIMLISNVPQLLVAMFLANAKPALSIGGAMGGCMADFFFPSIMWIKHYSHRGLFHWQNILCMIFAGFGVVTTVISVYQAILDAIDSFASMK